MASFVPIAALSNAGYAAISLGRESGPSRYLFRVYAMGVGDTVGLILYGVGILGALMCLGFACECIAHSLKSMLILRDRFLVGLLSDRRTKS